MRPYRSRLSDETEVAGLGERFDAEVRAACAVLLDYPELGVPIDSDLKRLVLERFRIRSSTLGLQARSTFSQLRTSAGRRGIGMTAM
jgi:hypothetical protein